jgi:hypothetical protein
VFCPVVETTERVLGERRSAFLLDLEGRLRDTPDLPRLPCGGNQSLAAAVGHGP